jgi:hypothetical protein
VLIGTAAALSAMRNWRDATSVGGIVMGKFNSILFAAAAGAVLCAIAGSAVAGSVTEGGETLGLGLGAPLPQGLYFVDTSSYISRSNKPDINAVVNIPVVVWSTPWKLFGGRVEAYSALPEDTLSVGGVQSKGFYNIPLLVGEAWDLGDGLNVSNFIGGYSPMNTGGLATDNWVFNDRAAVTYNVDGWSFTTHTIYGYVGKDIHTGLQDTPDYMNYDLTALKTIGKWSLGPVAYGSRDLSGLGDGYKRQSQFAMGGFVGYNFGRLDWQCYVTHDVDETGYTGEDTRVFMRVIVPLGNPFNWFLS